MILDAAGATNNTTPLSGQASDAQTFLVVSELMYHPSGDNLAEYVELLNISSSDTLNLKEVRFTQGVEFISLAVPSSRCPRVSES